MCGVCAYKWFSVTNMLCFVEQKLDEQDSMDTSQNDNTTEHSLPNNSDVADAEVCTSGF